MWRVVIIRIRRTGRTRCSADRHACGNTRPDNGAAVVASAIGGATVGATNGGAADRAANRAAAVGATNCAGTPSPSERVRCHRGDQEKTKADESQPFHHWLLHHWLPSIRAAIRPLASKVSVPMSKSSALFYFGRNSRDVTRQ